MELKRVFITKEYTGKGKNKKILVKVYDLDRTFIASAIHFQKRGEYGQAGRD